MASINDISILENNIKMNLNYLVSNKHKYQYSHYNNLINDHKKILHTLNDIKYGMNAERLIQESTPPVYNQYKSKGWEQQFDTVAENPPMYSIPQMNIWKCPYKINN
jgi:hypothetical protein